MGRPKGGHSFAPDPPAPAPSTGTSRAGEFLLPFDGHTAVCTVPASAAGQVALSLSLTRTDGLPATYTTRWDPSDANRPNPLDLFVHNDTLQYVAYGLKAASPTNSPADRDANLTLDIDGYDYSTLTRVPASGRCKLIDADVELVLDGHVHRVGAKTELVCPLPFGGCRYTFDAGNNSFAASEVAPGSCAASKAGVATCRGNASACAQYATASGAWPSQASRAEITIEVALEDSDDFTQSGVGFTLFPPIVLTSSAPEWGPVRGGFTFTADGTGLSETVAHLSVGGALRVWCQFSRLELEGVGTGVTVEGELIGGGGGVNCPVPVTLNRAAAYTVEISLNEISFSISSSNASSSNASASNTSSADYASGVQIKLYDLIGAQPKSGPLNGTVANVSVTMTKTYLPSNALPPSLLCKFTCGAQVTISVATLPQAGGQYQCTPPAVGAPCPDGALAIAIADLPELYTSAVDFQRYASPALTLTLTPTPTPTPNLTLTLTRYASPTASALSPSVGPSGGGFYVSVQGTNLLAPPYGVPVCVFGGSTQQSGDASLDGTSVSCRSPQLSPKQHTLSLSLNGAEYDQHATDLRVTIFTLGSRAPVSVPIGVARDVTLTVSGFPTASDDSESLKSRLESKGIALVCRFAAVDNGDDARCGALSHRHVLARTHTETSVVCPAPLLAALGPTNTQGACEIEVEACILEGAAAATAYAVWRELSAGATAGAAGDYAGASAGADPDLTARLTGGGDDDVTASMFFSESGLKLWYYEPPHLKAIEVLTRTLGMCSGGPCTDGMCASGDVCAAASTCTVPCASVSTGSALSAYAYQGGTVRVRGTFPRWPQSTYLRPNPLCRFGADATSLSSASHDGTLSSGTEVVCHFAAHKLGLVDVAISMSGEAGYFYGGLPDESPVSLRYEGCAAGQYAPTYSDECRDCELGKFQDLTGMASCKVVAHDEYVDYPGATRPSSCPENTNHSLGVTADSIEQCVCIPGTYSSVISTSPSTGLADEWTGGQPGHPCLPCDIAGQGGNCTGGIALPLAKQRFWCDGATSPQIPITPAYDLVHPRVSP